MLRTHRHRSIRSRILNSATKRVAFGVLLAASSGCGGTKTLMPPRIDLQAFRRIGLVEFSCSPKRNLQTQASQDFIQSMQASQPGVPVLELGGQASVLEAIGRDRVDSEAIRAIGKKFDVDAVIVGNLEISDVKPRIGVSQVLSSVDLQADVEGALTTRMYEARGGATVWTRSATSKETVADVGVKQGGVHFGAADPDATYGNLIQSLVNHVTQDFRPYWVKQ